VADWLSRPPDAREAGERPGTSLTLSGAGSLGVGAPAKEVPARRKSTVKARRIFRGSYMKGPFLSNLTLLTAENHRDSPPCSGQLLSREKPEAKLRYRAPGEGK
jgi:hypothetical protein